MADCRWINANGGNWNTAANWSTGTVPTAADNVIIDAASFAANGKVITVDAVANCLNFDCSAADQTFTLANSAYAFNVYGSFTGSANLTVSFTGTGYWYFKATTAVNITSNATVMNANRIYFDGVGGTWLNQDDWNAGASSFNLVNGTWNTNSKNITTTNDFLTATGTKTLTLGSSVFSIKGWGNAYATNFTFNHNTSTVILLANGSGFYGANTFYNLTFNASFIVSSGVMLANNIVVTHILTMNGGNATNYRHLIASTIIGTSRAITTPSANVVASNCDFRDITFVNAINFSAITGGSGDCGGNTGITFTPSQPQWYKHTSGACSWSDATKWFADQAKTIPGRVPLPQDDATFDAGSFTGISSLTVNCTRIGGLNLSTVNFAITFGASVTIDCYGNYILGPTITQNTGIVNLMGNGSFILNSFNSPFNYLLRVSRPSSSYIAYSDIIVNSGYSGVYNGSLDMNGFNSKWYFLYLGPNAIFNMGSGLCEINTLASNIFYASPSSIIYPGTSTIKLNQLIGSSDLIFDSPGKTFNKVLIAGNHSGNYDIKGSNTIAELIIESGRKVRFTAGTTQTINKLTAIGTAVNPITIGSITNAQHTLALAAGNPEVECDYLNISYSNATPAVKWFAGSHSVDAGNNTGWRFADLSRFFAWAHAAGLSASEATLQVKQLLQAIAAGSSQSNAALLQLRHMVTTAAGVSTTEMELHTRRYITALANGQCTADSYVHVLLPIASHAAGTSDAAAAMHQLIYALADAAGISVTEATLLVYAYPVEIFEAISKITTRLEARSVITTIITRKSKIF